MSEKNEIRAVEVVRRIRDEMATVLEGKSHAEIIAYFKKAGDFAREEAKRLRKIELQTELHG
jgi:hypothetical protein